MSKFQRLVWNYEREKQIDSAQSLQCFTGQSALLVAATSARATFCSRTALSATTSGPWKMPLWPARCLASLGFVFSTLPPFFTWPALLNVSYHPRISVLFALPCCVPTTISQIQAIRATAQSTFGEMHNVNYTMDRVTSKLFIKIFCMNLKFNNHSIHSCQATLDFFLQVRCYGNETDLTDCYHMSRCIKD